MISCPKCQAKTYVLDSRDGGADTIRRRRVCEACEWRVTTWESTLDPREKPVTPVAELERLKVYRANRPEPVKQQIKLRRKLRAAGVSDFSSDKT